MGEENTGFQNWLESTGQAEEIDVESAEKTPIEEDFFENEMDEYGGRNLISEAPAFREASSMGEELLEKPKIEKKSDGGAMSISPSREKTEYRTDYKPTTEYRSKDGMKTESKVKKSVRKGEIITDEEGTEWTIVDKEDGKLKAVNRETGEETTLDEEYLSTEASVFKKAQGEGIIDIEEKLIEEEKGEEKRDKEKEPDVSVEEKNEEKETVEEKNEENISMGDGIYKEYLMEIVTDPEIAPLVLEKLIRKFENEDELLSKLESILPEGEIEDDAYWVKNAGVIGKGIAGLIEKLGREECFTIILVEEGKRYQGGYTCDKEETLEYYKGEGYYEEGKGMPCIIFEPYDPGEGE